MQSSGVFQRLWGRGVWKGDKGMGVSSRVMGMFWNQTDMLVTDPHECTKNCILKMADFQLYEFYLSNSGWITLKSDALT